MQSTDWVRFLCVSLTIPLGIPYVLTLFGEWRWPERVVHQRLTLAMLIHVCLCLLLFHTWGGGSTVRMLIGTLPLTVYWALFWIHTKYRDGRMFFTLITVTLLCTMTDMLCNLFFGYGTPCWLALKLVLSVAITAILRIFVRAPFREMLRGSARGWTYASLIPLSLLVCIFLSGTAPAVFSKTVTADTITLLLGASALLIYLTLYRFFGILRTQYRAEQDAAVLRTQIESLEQQTQQMQERDRQAAILRHDLRHFVQLLGSSLRLGDLDEACAVLRSLESDIAPPAGPDLLHPYTGNTLLDAVLSMGAARAARENTAFAVCLTLPEELHASPPELAVVVSNMLENALNACAALPREVPREVRVSGGSQGRQYLLSIRNTVAAPIPLSPETGLPTTDAPGHGYGTQSIAAFAEKHGAFLHCTTEDGVFRMSLLI